MHRHRLYVDLVLLNGRPLSELIYGTIVVAIGLLCFLFGYWQRRSIRMGFFAIVARQQVWNERLLVVISLGVLLVSTVFFILFVRSNEVSFSGMEAFAQKKFIDFKDPSAMRNFREESLQSASYYYYRGAACAKFIFYLNLANLIYRRRSVASLSGALTIWGGLQTLVVFSCMNSRASVALLILDALIISYYLQGRVSVGKASLAVAAAALLMVALLGARVARRDSPLELVEKTVAGRDLMDVTKMALIIASVPGQMDYCYGETLVGWLAAPIPSHIWPNKPLWTERGVFINQRVYGAKHSLSGVPPGLPAELYWNFGLPGVFLGMFIAGVALRSLYVSFAPYRESPAAVLIYSIVVTRLTLFMLGSDVGTGILKTALDVVPLALMIFVVTRSDRAARR
jgi:hypothetical protein